MSSTVSGTLAHVEHDACSNRATSLRAADQAAPVAEPCELNRARFELRSLAYRRIARDLQFGHPLDLNQTHAA